MPFTEIKKTDEHYKGNKVRVFVTFHLKNEFTLHFLLKPAHKQFWCGPHQRCFFPMPLYGVPNYGN